MKSHPPRAFSTLLLLTACVAHAFVTTCRASDPNLVAALQAKGAEVKETQGEITGVSLKSKVAPTPDEVRLVKSLTHVKNLSWPGPIDDAALAALAGLTDLESFSTNGMDVTDEGVRVLGSLKKLHNIAFFHPGKKFTGTGLAALADVPALESLTVAGSVEFGDDGMAAVGKLSHLKGFRTWHSGVTSEGVKKLLALKELKNLTIGQRLASKPPTSVSDETVAVLAGFKSLESLALQEARLTLPALSQLKQIPHLKKLSLDGIDIPQTDIDKLRPQMPQTDIKWTAPDENGKKRIDALFGAK